MRELKRYEYDQKAFPGILDSGMDVKKTSLRQKKALRMTTNEKPASRRWGPVYDCSNQGYVGD